MDIIEYYHQRKHEVENNVRLLGEIYYFNPRESAIRLASAMGSLANAIQVFEENPDKNVLDFNDWNVKSYDEIINCIIDGVPAIDDNDFIYPNIDLSSFNVSDDLPSSSEKVRFVSNKIVKSKSSFKLKNVITKLKISKKNKKQEDDITCGICNETTKDWKTDCNHSFCDKCAKKWFDEQNKNSCPICRASVKTCSPI